MRNSFNSSNVSNLALQERMSIKDMRGHCLCVPFLCTHVCNTSHFHHTVSGFFFVQHSIIYNILLKMHTFLLKAHKIMRNMRISNILWDR